jgi:hypothetical protein
MLDAEGYRGSAWAASEEGSPFGRSSTGWKRIRWEVVARCLMVFFE